MDVLGVDPSLTMTGMAKSEAGLVSARRFATSPVEGLAGMRRRIRWIVRAVLAFAPAECVTVIEAPVLASGGMSGEFVARCGLYHFLVDQLFVRGPVVAVAPPTRALYATGSGRAGKREVLASMRARHPDVLIPDHNAADALALCGMGARWSGHPIDPGLTGRPLEAMATPAWPQLKGDA
ncbi:hypothetical protein [Agromyces larvae]|uniref:Uncharacterized protein n=1 Tax=Agromyces larvae TaxID=2929802 RepID=A0ABY4C5Q1_9MICO|nr:hypothetical protein [Agromyces larvae]UOE45511.1 hypothetical protein MTO99_07065 [Agromyces larvae]